MKGKENGWGRERRESMRPWGSGDIDQTWLTVLSSEQY
jgi:hypothetical protein